MNMEKINPHEDQVSLSEEDKDLVESEFERRGKFLGNNPKSQDRYEEFLSDKSGHVIDLYTKELAKEQAINIDTLPLEEQKMHARNITMFKNKIRLLEQYKNEEDSSDDVESASPQENLDHSAEEIKRTESSPQENGQKIYHELMSKKKKLMETKAGIAKIYEELGVDPSDESYPSVRDLDEEISMLKQKQKNADFMKKKQVVESLEESDIESRKKRKRESDEQENNIEQLNEVRNIENDFEEVAITGRRVIDAIRQRREQRLMHLFHEDVIPSLASSLKKMESVRVDKNFSNLSEYKNNLDSIAQLFNSVGVRSQMVAEDSESLNHLNHSFGRFTEILEEQTHRFGRRFNDESFSEEERIEFEDVYASMNNLANKMDDVTSYMRRRLSVMDSM